MALCLQSGFDMEKDCSPSVISNIGGLLNPLQRLERSSVEIVSYLFFLRDSSMFLTSFTLLCVQVTSLSLSIADSN